MSDEKAEADVQISGPRTLAINRCTDVQISGPRTLAILELLIVTLFSTPLVICFWSVVLGLAVHGARVQ